MTNPGSSSSRRVVQYPSEYPRAWLWYLGVGVLTVLGYGLVPTGSVPAAVVYQIIGLSAAGALLVGVWMHQPARRTPWFLMSLGMALWSIADAIGSWWAITIDADAFPTPADAVYLLGYVAVTTGVALLLHAGRRGRDPAGTLDSLILTTALAVLSWVLLARPIISAYAESPLAAAVAVSYPLADIALAGLLIRLLTTSGGRTRAYRLLVVALLLLIVADSASSALQQLTFGGDLWLDYLWLASYVVWGAAGLHPSMVVFSAPATPAPTRFTRTRLAALTISVVLVPVVLAVQTALGLTPTIWAVVIFSIIAFLLVVARMYLSMQQIQAANAEREAAQDQLAHQAAHDPLTGLANRAQAMLLIAGALNRAQRSGAVIGLLFVDLDGFKQVNDTLGHPAGDEVLAAVADRMRAAVRAGDVVARLGGDEFLVLLEPLDEQASGVAVGERVIAALSEPMLLRSGHQARIGASIGLAISQDAGTDADRLLQEADLAVYRAKSAGRGRIEVFDRGLRERLLLRARLEDAIRTTLETNRAELRLLPVVELITGELSGLEARVRCRVDRDLVERGDLIADLGRSPAIIELDRWTMQQALISLMALGEQHVEVPVSVPMTMHHLLLDRVRDDVLHALAAAGASPDRLVLMLTAAELTDDLRMLANLDELRRRGVRVCLDGFGAGAAPTNQLLRLPVSIVRLDAALLRPAAPLTPAPDPSAGDRGGSTSGPTTMQMLRLTAQTAHAFGYRVVAPGLDDAASVSAATAAGCEFGQGLAAADLLPDDAAMAVAVSWRSAT